MPKFVYCTNCGIKSPIIRKALPKYSAIIDLITPHICAEEPIEFDLSPNPAPTFVKSGEEKFVEKLNDLIPPPRGTIGTDDLRDRRTLEHTKQGISTAPNKLLEHMKNQLGGDNE